jgi:hypothetical protein
MTNQQPSYIQFHQPINRLDTFTGRIDFTNLLIIHSCDHVVVPNDTFVGVDIVEQLKFIGIKHLNIHSHAFRGLRISPKQLVIQDSHVSLNSPNYHFIPTFLDSNSAQSFF